MCGIAGWISWTGGVERDPLVRMLRALAHRGPDGEGIWVSPNKAVGFVHRRLSIIDLSVRAGQPMSDATGRACVVFNGEIFNHRVLRSELERSGMRFLTDHSDTEVLLNGYLYWGIDGLLERIVGMFAFGLFDAVERKLFLVRDRVGVKPLYVALARGSLAFASEAKALLVLPWIHRELDRENFYHFLSFRSLPAPRTLFKGIEKVAAGEAIEISLSGDVKRREYWNPLARPPSDIRTLGEAAEELRALLGKSVDLRLEADTDVGLFLSGGLDSAFLLAHMAGVRGRRVKAFTATYPEHPAFDEGAPARSIASRYGAQCFDVPIDEQSFIHSLHDVAYFQDEPIAAPVCVPAFLLAKEARAQQVPVILTGEGSDELFIGYPRWIALRILHGLNAAIPDFPGNATRNAIFRVLNRFLPMHARFPEVLRRAASGQPLFWGGAMDFSESQKRLLVAGSKPATQLDTYEIAIAPYWRKFTEYRDPADQTAWMSFLDLRFRLPELMLPRVDKMGMASGVEGRVPFLDHRIIEFVLSLPPGLRAGHGLETKPLLKAAIKGSVPGSLLVQTKQGFQAPVRNWKGSAAWKPYIEGLRSFARQTGLFDEKVLAAILAARGDRLYFSLVNFMFWHNTFIERSLPDLFPPTDRPGAL